MASLWLGMSLLYRPPVPPISSIAGCTVIGPVSLVARHLLTALMYQSNVHLNKAVLDGVWCPCTKGVTTLTKTSRKSLTRLIRPLLVTVLMPVITITNATSFVPRLVIRSSKLMVALCKLSVMANVMNPGPPNPCVESVNKLFTVFYKG